MVCTHIYDIKHDCIICHYTYHWSAYINIDYTQHGQTNQHGGNKYKSLHVLESIKGLCHPPTTSHMA